jgi:exopolysaccharide biosynthesis polyprenyl glycosylphosphotransferase
MVREQNDIITKTHKALDICLTAMAFVGAYFIKRQLLPESFRGLTTAPNYYIVLLMIIIIWYITFNVYGVYRTYRTRTYAQIFWNMTTAVSIGMLILGLCLYFFSITEMSRLMIGLFFILDIVLLAASKGLAYRILTHFREKGFNSRNLLIVGSRERAKDVIESVGDHLVSGYKVLGCLDTDPGEVGKVVRKGLKVIGTVDQLKRILLQHVVDELVFAMPLSKIKNADKCIALAEEMGVAVRILPDWQIHKLMYNPAIAHIRFQDFLGLPSMGLHSTPTDYGELIIKNAIDYLSAGIALLLSLPLFLIVAAAIKTASKGPVFFKQERCGLNGRKFMLYKFRTMTADAEIRRHELRSLNEADGPVFKIKNDPRIIPFVGTFLRKTSLDELPQLINVLRGEMTLVGPRPPIPSEVEEYDIWQRRRLSMKPGLTCIWQSTSNRNEVGFEDWMKMDLSYIDNWSLSLDMRILLKTATTVLTGAGR